MSSHKYRAFVFVLAIMSWHTGSSAATTDGLLRKTLIVKRYDDASIFPFEVQRDWTFEKIQSELVTRYNLVQICLQMTTGECIDLNKIRGWKRRPIWRYERLDDIDSLIGRQYDHNKKAEEQLYLDSTQAKRLYVHS